MSRTIELELDQVFKKREDQQLKQTYDAMEKWMGTGSPKIADASQTIDQTLYGKDGVWKGERAE